MAENSLAAAQQLLNASPVVAIITDKTFKPLWFNYSYKKKFDIFNKIDDLLSDILLLEDNDAVLFKFKKVFIPIKVRDRKTGENIYLTKFPVFKGDKFIISLVMEDQWVDDCSYSDTFFKEAFLMTPSPIVLFSFKSGKIKYLNAAFSKICSIPTEHITNMCLADLFPDAKETIEEYLSHQEPYTKPFILNAVQIDNKGLVLEISPFVFNKNGNVMVVFNVQDITKHIARRMEVLNDDSEDYAVFFKSMTEAVIVTEEKKIIKVNEKACRYWGYNESELLGNHISVLFREDKIHSQGNIVCGVQPFVGVRKDGSLFNGEKISKYFFIGNAHIMVNVLNPYDKKTHNIVFNTDDEMVNTDVNFEKKVLDHQPNLIAVYNKNGGLISCNKAMLDYFKCASFADFKRDYNDIHKFFLDRKGAFLTPESGSKWFTIPAENPYREYKTAMADVAQAGEVKIFVVKSSEIEDEEASYVVSFSDITDTVQTTLAVKDVNSILVDKNINVTNELMVKETLLIQQQKLAYMGEMLNVITHQWKQPLNAIGIIAQNIVDLSDKCENCDIKKDIGELSSSIFDYIKFMSETADNFKDFLKFETNTTEFSIDRAIVSIIKILNDIFNNDDIVIGYSLTKGCEGLLLKGNMNDFRQVIMNSIANSKDAIASKRQSTSSKFQGKIDINLSMVSADVAEIKITDNGTGIPPCDVPKVFDRHFTTKENGGTGIGMYISKIIVDNLGGTIECGNCDNGAYVLIKVPIINKKDL